MKRDTGEEICLLFSVVIGLMNHNLALNLFFIINSSMPRSLMLCFDEYYDKYMRTHTHIYVCIYNLKEVVS